MDIFPILNTNIKAPQRVFFPLELTRLKDFYSFSFSPVSLDAN